MNPSRDYWRLWLTIECLANLEASKFRDLKNTAEVSQNKIHKQQIMHLRSLIQGIKKWPGMFFPSCLYMLRAGNMQSAFPGGLHLLANSLGARAAVTSIGPYLISMSMGHDSLSRSTLLREAPRIWHVGSPWHTCYICVGTSTISLYLCCLLEDPTGVARV